MAIDPVPTEAPAIVPGAGEHAFDFLHGKWHVHNRRLRASDGSWYEVEAISEVEPILGGAGNLGYYEAVIDGQLLLGFNPAAVPAGDRRVVHRLEWACSGTTLRPGRGARPRMTVSVIRPRFGVADL